MHSNLCIHLVSWLPLISTSELWSPCPPPIIPRSSSSSSSPRMLYAADFPLNRRGGGSTAYREQIEWYPPILDWFVFGGLLRPGYICTSVLLNRALSPAPAHHAAHSYSRVLGLRWWHASPSAQRNSCRFFPQEDSVFQRARHLFGLFFSPTSCRHLLSKAEA